MCRHPGPNSIVRQCSNVSESLRNHPGMLPECSCTHSSDLGVNLTSYDITFRRIKMVRSTFPAVPHTTPDGGRGPHVESGGQPTFWRPGPLQPTIIPDPDQISQNQWKAFQIYLRRCDPPSFSQIRRHTAYEEALLCRSSGPSSVFSSILECHRITPDSSRNVPEVFLYP